MNTQPHLRYPLAWRDDLFASLRSALAIRSFPLEWPTAPRVATPPPEPPENRTDGGDPNDPDYPCWTWFIENRRPLAADPSDPLL